MIRNFAFPRVLGGMVVAIVVWGSIAGANVARADVADRPNILWITSEDNGPELGCYGDDYAVTPNIDSLASRSLRYERCWSNAPVCAPARTTIISGMYATSLGGHHMRSGVRFPEGMKLYPQLLREAGYYCTNNSKTDYNFASADAGWHQSNRQAHWRNRPDDQTPFFAIFNFTTSHESQIRKRPHTPVHDPEKAPLPAYHPDAPEVRQDWAQYYDKVTEMDTQVGAVLAELEKDGLADSTIVFYYGDHGSGMPRSKRWPFDSGLRVPLVVHFPEQFRHLAPDDYEAGGLSKRLTAFVDLGPTALSLAGVEPPETMQGAAFAGEFGAEPKPFLFGYRGRMDERIDMVRTCTDGRYVYMRHFYPDRPYLKHVAYMFQTPTTRVWKELFDAGKLNEAQSKFWENKPVEELFDLESDPDEVHNLAGNPGHADRVAKMRQTLQDWMIETADMGVLPEAEMHRRCGDIPPRTYGREGKLNAERLVPLAFDATDTTSDLSLEELKRLAADDDSGVRYWAIRGIDLRIRDGVAEMNEASDTLREAMGDDSPSVAVAACDAILASGDRGSRTDSSRRLVELSNVETYGHYVPVAALNVVDIHRPRIDAESIKAILSLPRASESPPVRAAGYVGRMLDTLSGSGRQPSGETGR